MQGVIRWERNPTLPGLVFIFVVALSLMSGAPLAGQASDQVSKGLILAITPELPWPSDSRQAGGREIAVGHRSVSCDSLGWSKPEPLSMQGVTLRSPDLFVSGAQQVITGVNLNMLDSSAVGEPFFIGGQPPLAANRPNPEGDFQFLAPRAVIDQEGRVHLVWGEAAAPITTKFQTVAPLITDLWHASLHQGKWSPPRHLHHARMIKWSTRASSVLLDRDGQSVSLFFSTSAWAADPAAGLIDQTLHLTLQPDGMMTTRTVMPHVRAAYLAATASKDSRHVALVTWHPEHGPNTLHVVSSRDGVHWEEPRVLPTGSGTVTRVWLFVDSEERLHLVWLHALGELIQGGEFVRHAYLGDGSDEWLETEPLALPSGLNRGTVALDACDRVHVVAEVRGAMMLPELIHHRLDIGGWSEASVPSGGLFAMEPVWASDEDGQGLYLAWTEARPDSARMEASMQVWVSQLRQDGQRLRK